MLIYYSWDACEGLLGFFLWSIELFPKSLLYLIC